MKLERLSKLIGGILYVHPYDNLLSLKYLLYSVNNSDYYNKNARGTFGLQIKFT